MAFDNNVTIHGTVGGDPELRFTPAGDAVASFSVAWSPRKKTADGKWENGETTWFRCTAWRDMAENVAASITKGTRVIVAGSVQSREWEDKDGNTRTSVELNVDDIGVSLKWATAVVEKNEREKGDGAGNYEQPASSGGRGKKSEPSQKKHGGDEYPYDPNEEPF